MKMNALAYAFCLVLLTSTLANAEGLERLINKCARGDPRACGKLKAVVGELTDQGALAKVAVEATGQDVRWAAILKLTDQTTLAKVACQDPDEILRSVAIDRLTNQASLAKIAIENNDQGLRISAIRRLTDQAVLAKIAVGDRDWNIRKDAVERLNDQAVLAKIAVEEKVSLVRESAAVKLTNQATLAKIAIEDKDGNVRAAAAGKLTDQDTLAKIAVEDKEWSVRGAAVENLNDQALLARITQNEMDQVVRAQAIAVMDGSNPALNHLVGNLGGLTSDTRESIARIKLVVQEPLIRNRLPRLVFVAHISKAFERYEGQYVAGGGDMEGEQVIFELNQAAETLAKKKWITDFPYATTGLGFEPAHVHIGDLLADLLHNAVFTQEDFAGLSISEIPELRQAAVLNLTSQELLARIAVEDKTLEIRQAAERKLSDIHATAK